LPGISPPSDSGGATAQESDAGDENARLGLTDAQNQVFLTALTQARRADTAGCALRPPVLRNVSVRRSRLQPLSRGPTAASIHSPEIRRRTKPTCKSHDCRAAGCFTFSPIEVIFPPSMTTLPSEYQAARYRWIIESSDDSRYAPLLDSRSPAGMSGNEWGPLPVPSGKGNGPPRLPCAQRRPRHQ